MVIVAPPPPESKTEVIAQLKNWERRLNELYDTVEAWVKHVPGVECERGVRELFPDSTMRHFHVRTVQLPALKVYKDKRAKFVSFEPDSPFFFNATGRVMLVTHRKGIRGIHKIYDYGGIDGERSQWEFQPWKVSADNLPFAKKVLLDLLENGK